MSKIQIVGPSTGTGTLTLTSEATNTDQTITFPNTTATIVAVAPGTAGNVVTSDGTAWVSQAVGGGFAAGTVMLFGQTSAPTGWTKDTTNYNNSGLRVVTGSASTGGSVDFTTAFASQTPTGSVAITSITGSVGSTTLTTPQIPSHTHSLNTRAPGSSSPTVLVGGDPGTPAGPQVVSNSTGGGGSHDHPLSVTGGSATFTGNAINLAVKYVDVIRATKN